MPLALRVRVLANHPVKLSSYGAGRRLWGGQSKGENLGYWPVRDVRGS